jgi:hypothetical protein
MKTIINKGAIITADFNSTKKIHSSEDYFVCDCQYCRNFHEAIEEHIPNDLSELLENLGIDILKPSEAVEYGMIGNTVHYIVDYHFIGRIDDTNYPEAELDTEITDHRFYPNDRSLSSKLFDSFDIVALRINLLLPWKLNEKYEG